MLLSVSNRWTMLPPRPALPSAAKSRAHRSAQTPSRWAALPPAVGAAGGWPPDRKRRDNNDGRDDGACFAADAAVGGRAGIPSEARSDDAFGGLPVSMSPCARDCTFPSVRGARSKPPGGGTFSWPPFGN